MNFLQFPSDPWKTKIDLPGQAFFPDRFSSKMGRADQRGITQRRIGQRWINQNWAIRKKQEKADRTAIAASQSGSVKAKLYKISISVRNGKRSCKCTVMKKEMQTTEKQNLHRLENLLKPQTAWSEVRIVFSTREEWESLGRKDAKEKEIAWWIYSVFGNHLIRWIMVSREIDSASETTVHSGQRKAAGLTKYVKNGYI